jgi:hypothetical protein
VQIAVLVRDVLRHAESEAEKPMNELIVQVIESSSVCCLPVSWDVYRAGSAGQLVLALAHSKEHVDVGPGETWTSLYHFEFSLDAGTVSIRSFLSDSEPQLLLHYRPQTGRYDVAPSVAKNKKQGRAF